MSELGQHKDEIRNKERCLVEIIKYEAKIFTEPGSKKVNKKKGSAKIYARALYNIYSSMKGCRLFRK